MTLTTMNVNLVKEAVVDVLGEMKVRPIPVGISNRHLHLSQHDYDILFPNQPITILKMLYQPGYFAAEQSVTLVGPKGKLERVRILGPVRGASQVEVSKTDARTLGIKAPLRISGDIENSPGIKLVSEFAELTIDKGVIVAQRHIHMSPLDALIFGVKHGDEVKVSLNGTSRSTIWDNVGIRVSEGLYLEMHIDTDEANASDADDPNAYASLMVD